ncbi:MAG: ankyrin repeat domain-containing protein [Verrucomicrobiota bacterium]|nr:ankyrin repeat domain-containing protein [Verrucomicrobiota bacterium]
MGIVALFAAISASRQTSAQQDINRALLDAADRGELAAVDDLLRKGADPNTFDRENFATPLRRAVYQGHLKIIEELLDWGADPRVGGTVVIDETVYKKREDVARLLMSRGVDINERDSNGTPTLERQLWGTPADHPLSQVEDIAFLLKLGADPNAQSPGGITALMMVAGRFAMSEGAEETKAVVAMMRLLLKSGARVETEDDIGATALIHAMDGGTLSAIKVLTEAGANINHQNKNGMPPLLMALQRRDRDGRIDYLLGHGANVKIKDKEGMTSVMAATRQGYLKHLSLFLQRGVDPNARTQSGRTAAHSAAAYYNFNSPYDNLTEDKKDRATAVDMLRVLAQAKADLTAADNEGFTPMHVAARAGYTETLRFLLDRGGNQNQLNAKGETPVFLTIGAILDGFPKLKLLVSKGANVNTPNIERTTPLMLAAMTRNRGMLMYLLGQKADPNATDKTELTALNVASAIIGEQSVDPRDYAAMTTALASSMSSVDQRDRSGMTPLMWAAISNIPDALTPLLKKGADINARSGDGRSPLMWAACANADRTIPELLNHSADRSAKDNNGRTALDWARALDQPVAKLLESQLRTP